MRLQTFITATAGVFVYGLVWSLCSVIVIGGIGSAPPPTNTKHNFCLDTEHGVTWSTQTKSGFRAGQCGLSIKAQRVKCFPPSWLLKHTSGLHVAYQIGWPFYAFEYRCHVQSGDKLDYGSRNLASFTLMGYGNYNGYFLPWPNSIRVEGIIFNGIAPTILREIIAFGVSTLLRKNRVKKGRCATCGYKLALQSKLCPECGLVSP
jgi:hypothetical protein